jgi:hypothetical protein
MPEYWSLDKLQKTAKRIYDHNSKKHGTEETVIEKINNRREQEGLDHVTQQDVKKALQEGEREHLELLSDVVEALLPESITRDESDPTLHVEVENRQVE